MSVLNNLKKYLARMVDEAGSISFDSGIDHSEMVYPKHVAAYALQNNTV